MKYIHSLVIALFLLSFTPVANGQYSELAIGVGVSNYFGDLSAEALGTNIRQGGIVATGDYIYSLNKYLNIRGSFTFTRLRSTDAFNESLKKRQRNLDFKTSLYELGVMAELHFFGFEYRNLELLMSPYLVAGVAGFYFDPTTQYNGETIKLQPLGTEGQGISGYDNPYSKVSLALPFGVGLKFKPSSRVCFSIEGLMRYTFTDYIDDVSQAYVEYDVLLNNNGELAANLANRVDEYRDQPEGSLTSTFAGTQRGNPSVADYYFTTVLKLQFYLGDGFRSPLALIKSHKTYCPTF